MISPGELRKGVAIELDGTPYQVIEYNHIKVGRGSAQIRLRLRDIKEGLIIERTFQSGEKWPRARLERRPAQFLYRDGETFHLMDSENYEQFEMHESQVGDALYAIQNKFAAPDFVFFLISGEVVIFNVMGGIGTLVGPFAGAAFFLLLREGVSRFLTEYYLIPVGILFILMIIFLPQGLLGFLRRPLNR